MTAQLPSPAHCLSPPRPTVSPLPGPPGPPNYTRPIETSDTELVERAQNGDRTAMDALLSRHYDRLYAVCRRLAGNDADAADGCQEALLAIVRGLERFDGRASFKTWSYRVATNACLDELRRRKRRPVTGIEAPERISDGPGIESQVVDRMTFDHALPSIPEEFRAPVVLRDVIGMDYAEIAETLGIAPGTVRSRIARGRRHLARLLEPEPPESTDGKTRAAGEPDSDHGTSEPST